MIHGEDRVMDDVVSLAPIDLFCRLVDPNRQIEDLIVKLGDHSTPHGQFRDIYHRDDRKNRLDTLHDVGEQAPAQPDII